MVVVKKCEHELFHNSWVYDVEVLPNLFTLVARKVSDKKEYEKFILHETQNDKDRLVEWLGTRPCLIGYNNLNYDSQIIEYIHRNPDFDQYSIYKFGLTLPLNDPTKGEFDTPYSEWDISYKNIDLFKINHYDNSRTSLKWLAFTMRSKKLKDMEFDPHTEVPKYKVVEVLRYNTTDVNRTYELYVKSLSIIQLRIELADKFRNRQLLNMSDSSLGQYIFKHILTKEYKISSRRLSKGTHHTKIYGKDILLPYINFESEVFKRMHEIYKNRIYENDDGSQLADIGDWKDYAMFEDMVFVFGSGGVHACYKAGEFTPADDEEILSIDVSSFYPNLAIKNKFYPLHIGKAFCDIYEGVYNTRQTYEKGSGLNYAYKQALNSVFGKSNNKYSLFYDLSYLLKITVNGQLLLTTLAEKLAKVGRLLMINTDGIEILIKKKDKNSINQICEDWEIVTGLELEHTNYKKLIIKDVNNYIAIDVNNKPKRKGVFEIYYDITEEDGKPHRYNKNPSASIIPKAVFEYYANDKPIQETIRGEDNIFEFCLGVRRQNVARFWLIKSSPNGLIDIDRRGEKHMRYYISPSGSNLYRFWKDNRKNYINAVHKDCLVKLAQTIHDPSISENVGSKNEYDIDYDYYEAQAQSLIDIISNETRDKAYIKYHKDLAKNDI